MIYWKKDKRYLRKILDSAHSDVLYLFIDMYGNANVRIMFPAVHLRKDSILNYLESKQIPGVCDRVEKWIISVYDKPLFEEVVL